VWKEIKRRVRRGKMRRDRADALRIKGALPPRSRHAGFTWRFSFRVKT
jgi:hypothetical protein